MDEIKYFLLDLVFPRYCLGCSELLGDLSDAHLCSACRTAIKFKTGFACAFCSAPVVNGKTCPFCIKEHRLDHFLAVTAYENTLAEKIIKTLKYHYVRSLADEIALLMIEYLEKKMKTVPLFDFVSPIVTPVPLHRRRLNWRGFNQSELIAQRIAARFGWPFNAEILKRTRHNKPQVDIVDRPSRIRNMSGVFSCSSPLSPGHRPILLIDDVATTGSTLDDCARALKGAGAGEVTGFVFARGK